jgi:SanA protein
MGAGIRGFRACVIIAPPVRPSPVEPPLRSRNRHLAIGLTVLLAVTASAPMGMLGWLHATAAPRIARQPADLPALSQACVMGARVHGPGEPSPVAAQRVAAAAALAHTQPGLRLLVSGHEPANHEATELAAALVAAGVAPERIQVDPHGNSTIANVRAVDPTRPVVFVSQGYHLPRTLWMARQQGLDAWGLAAEHVAPTAPGASRLGTVLIRARRHLREGVLALLHGLGAYEGMAVD